MRKYQSRTSGGSNPVSVIRQGVICVNKIVNERIAGMTTALKTNITIHHEIIENKILFTRGRKVMFDRDLAQLYRVETKVLNQAVKRNIERFPKDFMFQLTTEETKSLRSQSVTLKRGQHLKYLPYAFTEHGILMLSSVLNSGRAIQVNIQIMRTFTKLREILATHAKLRHKIEEMEKKYDYQFKVVFETIKQLFEPPQKSKELIGFRPRT
jgi:hypothetical protein